MQRERKTPKRSAEKVIKVRLTPADQKALESIITAGWATNTTTGVRFALKLASDRVSSGAAA